MTFKTEQEALWAGEFGTAYIQRNQGDALLAANLDFFGWGDVLALRGRQHEIFSMNQQQHRTDGSATGTGQKLWNRAKRAIPGGACCCPSAPGCSSGLSAIAASSG